MPDERLGKALKKAPYTGKNDPQTPKDQEMSNRHLLERYAFDKKHQAEHLEAADKPGYDPEWNKQHANHHKKEMDETQKLLKKRGVL